MRHSYVLRLFQQPVKITGVVVSSAHNMSILYLIIPLSVLLVIAIIWFFLWAVRSGQFDDMEGPAHRILMDDDDLTQPKKINKPEEEGE